VVVAEKGKAGAGLKMLKPVVVVVAEPVKISPSHFHQGLKDLMVLTNIWEAVVG
jgi:hypothetical protein